MSIGDVGWAGGASIVGGVLIAGAFALVAAVSRAENERRAARMAILLGVSFPLPYLAVGLLSFPHKPARQRNAPEPGTITAFLKGWARKLGAVSVGVTPLRDHHMYSVVCPLVARDAGLGEIGRMGLLMTPEIGPRVRIAVVTTDVPLVADRSGRDAATIDFCTHCRKCADACPNRAIPFDDRAEINGARRWGVRRSAPFRRLAISMDDLFYGKNPAPAEPPGWLRRTPAERMGEIPHEGP